MKNKLLPLIVFFLVVGVYLFTENIHFNTEYEEIKVGDTTAVFEKTSKKLDIYNKKAKNIYLSGVDEFRKGNPEKAKKLFILALNEYPQSSDILASLGNADYTLKDFKSAENSWRSSLNINPENSRSLVGFSALYYSYGDYSESIDFANQALNFESDNFSAHWFLALSYEKTNNINLAIRHYEEFVLIVKNGGSMDYANKKINELNGMYNKRVH